MWNKLTEDLPSKLIMALISIVVSVGTALIGMANTQSANSTEVRALKEAFEDHLKDAVSKRDYDHVIESLRDTQRNSVTKTELLLLERQIDEISAGVRDIRMSVNGRR